MNHEYSRQSIDLSPPSPAEPPECPRGLDLIDTSKSSITFQWQPPRGDAPLEGNMNVHEHLVLVFLFI